MRTRPAAPMEEASTAASPPPVPRGVGLQRSLRLLGGVIAPVTLLTALLYYFGYIRTNTLYLYFGVDSSVLDFSPYDYLLRAAEAVYAPLAALILLLLGSLWVHQTLDGLVERPGRWPVRGAADALLGTGAALLLLGGSEIVARDLDLLPLHDIAYPVALGAGTVLLAYGWYLRRRLRPRPGNPGDWLLISSGVLVLLLVVLSLFWATSSYAQAYGLGRAHDFRSGRIQRPVAVVYAREPLPLEAAGVSRRDRGDTEPYRWQYTGLRLLIRSGGRYFMVPQDGNGLARGPVVILPEDTQTVVALSPTPIPTGTTDRGDARPAGSQAPRG